MNASLSPAPAIIDRDRPRACRLAHAFGASVAIAFAALLAIMARFHGLPLPAATLAPAGCAIALIAGVLADLTVRPPQVLIDGGWLTVSGPLRQRSVQIDRLTGVSASLRAAGLLVLADSGGRRIEIETRSMVRNPLIWHEVCDCVRRSHRRGSLNPAAPGSLFWESLAREVEKADLETLAALDFEPSG